MTQRGSYAVKRQRTRGAITLRIVFWVVFFLWALIGGYLGLIWWGMRSMTTDYAALAPADAFRQVFRRPLPQGVTDLRAAGFSHIAGSVYMRFEVTDQGLKDLLADCAPQKPELAQGWLHQIDSPVARVVGLGEVRKIRHPEYYTFDATRQGDGFGGWFGILVGDRAQRRVYVIAALM